MESPKFQDFAEVICLGSTTRLTMAHTLSVVVNTPQTMQRTESVVLFVTDCNIQIRRIVLLPFRRVRKTPERVLAVGMYLAYPRR